MSPTLRRHVQNNTVVDEKISWISHRQSTCWLSRRSRSKSSSTAFKQTGFNAMPQTANVQSCCSGSALQRQSIPRPIWSTAQFRQQRSQMKRTIHGRRRASSLSKLEAVAANLIARVIGRLIAAIPRRRSEDSSRVAHVCTHNKWPRPRSSPVYGVDMSGATYSVLTRLY